MNSGLLRSIAASAFVLAITSTSTHAGGLWLYETGSPDMGTATAGRAAMARDASTAGSNPAGMTRLDRTQVMATALGLDVQAKFEGQTTFSNGLHTATETAGNGHNAGYITPAANLDMVYVAAPDLRLGLAVGSYFGLGMDYGDSWQGRYYVQNAELLTMGFNPSAGYRFNDWLSVGGGVVAMYGKLKQEMAVNNRDPLIAADPADGRLKIDADDWGWGYNLGVLFEPASSTRIGVTYRSEVELEFDDVAEVSGVTGPVLGRIATLISNSSLDMTMKIPQGATLSVVQQLNDRLALMANVGWQDWSSYGKVEVDLSTGSTSGSTTVDAGMKDTWHYAIGAHYRVADPWLLMLGFAYDTSPVEDSRRSVAMPLDRQVRYAAGVEYTVDRDVTVGFGYTFIDCGSAKIDQNRGPFAGHIVGEYDTNYVSAFGLNMNWKF